MAEDASPVIPVEDRNPHDVVRKKRGKYQKHGWDGSYKRGYPWFRVVYLLVLDPAITNDIGYTERFLLLSNNNDYCIDSFATKIAAQQKADYLNEWWEKDYRSIMRTKGNALWESLRL